MSFILLKQYRSSFSNWTLLSVKVADEDDLPVRFTAFEYRAFVREDATVVRVALNVCCCQSEVHVKVIPSKFGSQSSVSLTLMAFSTEC